MKTSPAAKDLAWRVPWLVDWLNRSADRMSAERAEIEGERKDTPTSTCAELAASYGLAYDRATMLMGEHEATEKIMAENLAVVAAEVAAIYGSEAA